MALAKLTSEGQLKKGIPKGSSVKALDTKVLVRFLVCDDKQAAKSDLFELLS